MSQLHKFMGGNDGGRPAGTLIFDSAGNLYGTTSDEGIRHASGTVFALTPNADGSWTHTVLHRFAGKGVKGPRAGLTLDPAGNLYGTATVGGPADGGGVFKLSPQLDGTWAYSTVRLFEGTPALHPYGGLILDSSGNLYGTASECGSKLENQKHCKGVVFELMP